MSRTLKQVVYGLLYLVIVGGILYLPTTFLKPAPSCKDGILNQGEEQVDCGGPCESCEIRTLAPVSVLPKILPNPLDANKTILFTELRNSNVAYGASDFVYEISFLNSSGEVLSTYAEHSLIYPGERTYRTELQIDLPFDSVSRVEGRSKDFVWKSLETMTRPRTQERDLQAYFEEDRGRLLITGIIKNDNPFDIRRAVMHALVSDNSGRVVGVSKTIVQDLTPLEDRSFEIFMPLPEGVLPETLSRPSLYVEVAR